MAAVTPTSAPEAGQARNVRPRGAAIRSQRAVEALLDVEDVEFGALSPVTLAPRQEPGARSLAQITTRSRRTGRIEVGATLFADLVALVAATFVGLAALASVSSAGANSMAQFWQNLRLDLVFPLATLGMFVVYGLYGLRRRRFRPRGFHDFGRFFHAVAAGTLATLGLGVLIHRLSGRAELSPAQLVSIALATFVAVPVGRAACLVLLRVRPGVRTRVLIVGSGVVAEQIRQHCAEDQGIEVVGMVDDDPSPGTAVLGTIAEIPTLCEQFQIDRVLVTFSRSHPADTIDKLRDLHGTIPISIVPRYFELMTYRSQVDEIDGVPVIDVATRLQGFGARMAKRTLDIIASGLGLLLLSPVIILASLLIIISSPGLPILGQTRIGRGGRPFRMWKLRTMSVDAHREREALAERSLTGGPMFKVEDDPRVFRVGRFLRRTSIDELPQLMNVLLGQMSLVGPRPFIPEEAETFNGWAARRFEVRPGLTGLWQVSGRSDLSHDQLQRLDYLYVASWSIFWDLRILWKTPGTVVRGRGAY
ncbi:MAG TPA: sugar transferase [Acidimicrobiales bacterium]|nr:sugar transferase [Acidimicrobiales bacterium]